MSCGSWRTSPRMPEQLAIDGGVPVRTSLLPYARQSIDETDVAAVVEILRSDWLTTGPMVAAFEREVAAVAGATEAVAVANGTAALHTAMAAIEVRAGDEVIVPAMTFAATANAVLYQGGVPVFADVEADTLLLSKEAVAAALSPRTKAVIGVDYTGQPCDVDALGELASTKGAWMVVDAAHSLGATLDTRPAAASADLATFSFHPVKHITTAEGGMVVTSRDELVERMRRFRNHGIDRDHLRRAKEGAWAYDVVDLGMNYRLSDLQCALGISQLRRLDAWLARRREIAARYDAAFDGSLPAQPLTVRPGVGHAYHLYVLRLDTERLSVGRDRVFDALRAEGVGANVHWAPVHLHPLYRERLGTTPGMCPVAEEAASRILSLPMFPAMSDDDVDDVIDACTKVLGAYALR
jgi:perosamine synthetase